MKKTTRLGLLLALAFSARLASAAGLEDAKAALKSMGGFAASVADTLVEDGGAFRVPLDGPDAAVQVYVVNGSDGSWQLLIQPQAGANLNAESLWPGMGSDVFGDATLSPAAVVVSSGDGDMSTGSWPAALKASMGDFGATVAVKKGVNGFLKVSPGSGGAFGQVKKAIGMGGGSVLVSGSMGPELLGKVISKARGKESDAAMSYEIKAVFPSATPPAFASLDKNAFFVKFPKTVLSVSGQGAAFQLSGKQAVTITVLGKSVDLDNTLSFSKNGNSYAIACDGSADADANLFGTAAFGFSVRKLTLGGDLSSSQAPGEREMKGFGASVGALVDVSGVGPLGGAFEVELINNQLTELALALSGGSGVSLGNLPGIKEIPGANEFSFSDLALGVRPKDKQAFVYGGLDWTTKGIHAASAVLLGKKDCALFFKAQGLTLRKLSSGIPASVDVIPLDNALVAISSGTLADQSPAMLPSPVRKMMAEIGASTEGKVTFGNGLTILTAFTPGDDAKLLGIGTSPMVLAGSVGGVFNGDPSFALYADMGGFSLPPSAQPGFIKAKNVTPKFFIMARDIKSAPTVDLGVFLDTIVTIGRDQLDLGLSTYVSMGASGAGVRATGTMMGDWRNPLGLQTMTFSNAVFGFGFRADGTTTLALGGKLNIDGDIFDSQNVIGLTPVGAPLYVGIAFKANRLAAETQLKLMDIFIRSIATGPLADAFNDEDKRNLQALANGPTLVETAKKSIPIDLVMVKGAQVYLATPGTPSDPALPAIQGMGVGVVGRLIFNGKEAGSVNSYVMQSKGLRLAGDIADFSFGELLSVKGAKLDVSVPMPLQGIPSFLMKGKSKFLISENQLDIELGLSKLKFVTKNDWGAFGYANFHAESKGESLLKPTDFILEMEGGADMKKGIRQELAPALTQALGDAGEAEAKALAKAQDDLAQLKSNLAAVKAEAKKNKQSSESVINGAQRELDKWDDKWDDVDDDIDDAKDDLEDAKDDPAKWDKVPGYAADLAKLYTKKGSIKASYYVAKAALKAAKESTKVVPVDAYPEVVAAQALVTEKQSEVDTLKASTQANQVALGIAADIKKGAGKIPVSIEEVSFKNGSMARAMKGEPQRLTVKMTLSLPGKKPLKMDESLNVNLMNPTAMDLKALAVALRDAIRDIDRLIKLQEGQDDNDGKPRKKAKRAKKHPKKGLFPGMGI